MAEKYKLMRKVVRHGNTRMVSLPRKWLLKNKIRDADKLICHTSNNKISYFIRSEDKFYERRLELDVSTFSDKYLKFILSTVHKTGYDHLILQNLSLKQREEVINRVHKELVGFEVLETKSNELEIHKENEYGHEHFMSSLNKLFHSATMVFENCIEALEKPGEESCNLVISAEAYNNRLTNFCERLLNKFTNITEGSTFLYITIWNAESLCDTMRDIAKTMKATKIVPHKMFLSELQSMQEQYREWNRLFRRFDHQKMDVLVQENRKKEEELVKISMTMKSKSITLYIPYFITLNRQISDFFASTIGYELTRDVNG